MLKDAAPEVAELADHALSVITDISCGRVRSQIASVQLKAAIQLRLECCDPIPTASNVQLNGGVSLVSILTGLRTQIEARDPDAFAPKALPPATPAELAELAEEAGYTGNLPSTEAAVSEDGEEAEDPSPAPNFAKHLIPPFAPGSRVRDDAPRPTRGKFITTDDDED